MTGFVTCAKHNAGLQETLEQANQYTDDAILNAAPNLKDCTGAEMVKNATVPTCAQMNDAIQDAVDALDFSPTGAAGGDLSGTYPNPTINPSAIQAAETTTTLAVSGVNYVYTNEDATQTTIEPAQFLSSDAGNALGTGADGRLKVLIPAQLPDDQVLSGDNSGTVAVTLTPVVDPGTGNTNYTIKADLKVAAQTPDAETNLLQLGASGYYVDADSVATAIAGDTTARTSLVAAIPDTAKTVRGLVNLTDLQQMGDGRKVFDVNVHVGNGNPASANKGTVTAIGQSAAGNATGSYQTSSGVFAGQNNTAGFQTSIGAFAGQNNYGSGQTASGVSAGSENKGNNQSAFGTSAGQFNVAHNQTASGVVSGRYNAGANSTFYGYNAGSGNGGALATGVTITPTSAIAGTVSPALPASVVGNSYPVSYGASQRVFTFTSTTEYTTVGGPTTVQTGATVYNGLQFDNITVLGANANPTASNQVMLGDTAVTEVRTSGTYFGAGFTTVSDVTLKENVEAIDSDKALAFRNGLQWKRYEVFSEEQVEIMEQVEVDGETQQKPTGRYEVKRHSQGRKYGLIAQDVIALTEQIGVFQDVVVKIGEYFDLDENGYPKKDAEGNVIKKERLGLDYDAIQVVILAGEQAAFSPAGRNK